MVSAIPGVHAASPDRKVLILDEKTSFFEKKVQSAAAPAIETQRAEKHRSISPMAAALGLIGALGIGAACSYFLKDAPLTKDEIVKLQNAYKSLLNGSMTVHKGNVGLEDFVALRTVFREAQDLCDATVISCTSEEKAEIQEFYKFFDSKV